tara:strand:- start:166 stop:510 length:345 start_codon:yes stop_codon:yes gene_type:complete
MPVAGYGMWHPAQKAIPAINTIIFFIKFLRINYFFTFFMYQALPTIPTDKPNKIWPVVPTNGSTNKAQARPYPIKYALAALYNKLFIAFFLCPSKIYHWLLQFFAQLFVGAVHA